ncbi:Rab32C, RAB family GTPase [Ectocarpus siliculosus]|uniref:Rab32C, RAB family GTPase n=1 Tax=Ectocarpus siliculosus TaxID=2880 RepID=D7FUI0_ECTSI|nr:Rab32C, RAB family GTPase [Ectocarpus siliculosus]|eukprot:CBJ31636.1 Rab32C, RAB family GTPase [Ectocarpus siliculosus]
MSSAAETSPVIKILVVGDAGVGKTSVIQRFVNDEFSPTHRPTIGVDFFIKEVALNGDQSESFPGTTVRVQLWDIAGQDRARKMNRAYFKGALGALVVYDISRPQTFDSAAKWKQELDANITLPNGSSLPVVLLGNKVDLEVAKVDVSYIDSFVETHRFVAWSDVSAKDAINGDFEMSVACLIQKLLCDEELFGPGMRRSAAAFSTRLQAREQSAHHTGSSSKGVRLALSTEATGQASNNGCCG